MHAVDTLNARAAAMFGPDVTFAELTIAEQRVVVAALDRPAHVLTGRTFVIDGIKIQEVV